MIILNPDTLPKEKEDSIKNLSGLSPTNQEYW